MARSAERTRLAVVASTAGFILVLALVGAFVVRRQYQDRLADGRRNVENISLLLASHLDSTVAQIDVALTQIVALHKRAAGTLFASEWEVILSTARASVAGVSGFTVVGADGLVSQSTVAAVLGQSRRDNPLFRQLRDHPGINLAADVPFFGQESGRLLIPLGRRLQNPDGSFAGMIVATFDPEELRPFYRSLQLGAGGRIWLLHPDGSVFVREPRPDQTPRSVADQPYFRQWVADGGDGFHFGSLYGADDDLSAYRSLLNAPLRIVVSLSRADILQSWYRAATGIVLAQLLMAGASFLAALLVLRQFAARAASAAELQLMAKRMADIGFLRFSPDLSRLELSDWARSLLRLPNLGPSADAMAFFNAVLEPDRTAMRTALARCRTEHAGFTLEFRVADQSGAEHYYWAEGEWDAAATGGPEIHVVCQDITARRAAENELRQSKKMEAIGQLTGGVAHDFNNILTVIIGNTEILADALAGQPALRHIAEAINRAAERGGSLTASLLSFSRQQPLRPRDVDLNALVGETGQLLRKTLGEHIDIETRLAPDVGGCRIDPALLQTALLNLALNARDAMRRSTATCARAPMSCWR